MIGLKYGEYSLQQTGRLWAVDTDIYDAPENEVQSDELAEADGAIVVKQRYKSKVFTVSGVLRTDTISETMALMDEFKTAMSRKNLSFDLDHGSEVRRYLATARNIAFSRRPGMRSRGWSVEFLSPDGMGWDLESRALLEPTGITVANLLTTLDVDGSYKAQPLITIVVNSVTSGTDKTITVSNGRTLRAMRVTRDWVAGDKLEIDCLKQTVFVNDAAHDFRGQFLEFEPGETSIGYIDDFSARDATLSVSYTRRWL